MPAWSEVLDKAPLLYWGPLRSFYDRLHIVLSPTSMTRVRHENVISIAMTGSASGLLHFFSLQAQRAYGRSEMAH